MPRLAEPRLAPLGVALGCLLALATPRVAQAYCQATVCDGGQNGVRCTPAESGSCGVPLTFKQGCIGYSLHDAASSQVNVNQISDLMRDAFATWSAADCGGGEGPGVRAFDLGTVSCGRKEYNLEAGNANVVFFHDDAWPYEGAGNTLALTTITFSLDDGAIYDADLEINGTVDLTLGDGPIAFDLPSIVTHEAGHMLGLAHSAEPDATMTVQYVPGDTRLRTLHPDDEAAICASYPPRDVSACDPTPRRGLATECDPAPPTEPAGCSCRAAGTESERSFGGLAAAMALVGAATVRRSARRKGHEA